MENSNNRRTWIIRGVLLVLIVALGIGYWWWQYEPPVNDNYQWIQVTGGLNMPTSMTPLDNDRILIGELDGQIRLMKNRQMQGELYLDLRDTVLAGEAEQGFFRVLADPNYADNGYIYVNYTAEPDGRTVIERYTVSADNPDAANIDSAELIYSFAQPDAFHNGGDMAFGPDGYLYIAVGESHQAELAQDLSSPLGSLLRLDVSEMPFTIPEDNPFIDTEDALGEIYHYGLRNPWRFSFDRETGDLWISDLGDAKYEEINIIEAIDGGGLNFGWPAYEAREAYDTEITVEDARMPDHIYNHYIEVNGVLTYYCGVTGGYVYRGSELPDFQGTYIFTDRCQGDMWTLKAGAEGGYAHEHFMDTGFMTNTFGEDAQGELYILTIDLMWQLVAR